MRFVLLTCVFLSLTQVGCLAGVDDGTSFVSPAAKLNSTRWKFCQEEGLDLRAMSINFAPVDWTGRRALWASRLGFSGANMVCLDWDGSENTNCRTPLESEQVAYGDASRYGTWCALNAHFSPNMSELMGLGWRIDALLTGDSGALTVNPFQNCENNFNPGPALFATGTPFLGSAAIGVALYSELEFAATGSNASIKYFSRHNGCEDQTGEELLGTYSWSTSALGPLTNASNTIPLKETVLDKTGLVLERYRIYAVDPVDNRLYISSKFSSKLPADWKAEFAAFLEDPRTNSLKWFKRDLKEK